MQTHYGDKGELEWTVGDQKQVCLAPEVQGSRETSQKSRLRWKYPEQGLVGVTFAPCLAGCLEPFKMGAGSRGCQPKEPTARNYRWQALCGIQEGLPWAEEGSGSLSPKEREGPGPLESGSGAAPVCLCWGWGWVGGTSKNQNAEVTTV